MNSSLFRMLSALPVVLLGASTTSLLAQSWPQLGFGSPITGFSSPVHIAHAGDQSGRLFVVELVGRIKVVKNGVIQPTPFLDIVDRTGGRQGLLSVAFPPNFATSRQIYVNYTDSVASLVISRFTLSTSDVVDPASEQILLTVPKPSFDGNLHHSGGELAFGPDGYLYFGIGDGDTGESAGDRDNEAQNVTSLRGKILRIDVSGGGAGYSIPTNNPLLSRPEARQEIWAVGVRNPWRSSFDRLTGDYYIADVGQNEYEEVNFQQAQSAGGLNFGWRVMEGPICCFPGDAVPPGGTLILPIASYPTARGTGTCMITGGRVYRGVKYPRMRGVYFYGDFCAGKIWGLKQSSGAQTALLYANPGYATFAMEGLVTFGEDEAGELYAADRVTGKVYPLTDVALNTPPIAQNGSLTTNENTPVNVSLVATDANGDSLTYSIVTPPSHGSLSGVGSTIQYQPATGYCGPDSFTFKASDGSSDSNAATISIGVNGVPVARNDTATTKKNKAVTVAVLINDADKDGGTLSVVGLSGIQNGTAVVVSNAVQFTPKAGFTGAARFSYTISDGQGATAGATVNVTVTAK